MLDISVEKSKFFQEARQEGLQAGLQEGRQEGQSSLIVRQLTKRFGSLPEDIVMSIDALPVLDIEKLS